MSVFPSAVRFMVYLSGAWTDLTDYWVEALSGHWGMQDNDPLTFLADTGILRFVLNNMDQRFTPEHASALAGWKKGLPAKLEIDYDGYTYPFLGQIQDIDAPLGGDFVDKCTVTVADWMEYAARTPIVNPTVQSDQRSDQMMTTLMGLMPIAPQATDFSEGVNTFPSAFDTVTDETKAYSEFEKIALSELGPVYLRKDREYGEMLVAESAHDRHGWRTLDALPVASSSAGLLLKEDGDRLLLETSDSFVLDESTTLTIDNDMLELVSDYGKRLVNYFSVSANPRRIDASAQILFQLDEPIAVPSGQTVTVKGSFADPNGGLPINGQNMITPVATTDYLLNTAKDGGGSNITANLTLVSTPYGADGFEHQVRNDAAYPGWLTKYNTRGYGIYYYNPIEHIASSPDSYAEYGYETERLDQRYQVDLGSGALYAEKVVEAKKQPHSETHAITFLANQSATLMMAFLNFGPGNLIRVKSTRRAVDAYFYIQGVKDFQLTPPKGQIMCTWILKKICCLLLGCSALAIEFTGAGETDAIDFGYVPYLTDLSERSISAWIYLDQFDDNGTIVSIFSDDAGYLFYIDETNETLQWYQKYDSAASWRAPIGDITTGGWYFVAVTKAGDSSDDPILYINGSSVTVTQISVPPTPEDAHSEEGAHLLVGNVKTATLDYSYGIDGKVKDVRIYNRILSADEVSEIYNSGTPDASLVTDGLKFQAFTVRTSDYDDYEDATLDDEMKVLDNMFGVVGTPHGSPVGRAP